MTNSFDFIDCAEHSKDLLHHFVTLTIKFSIINWCKTINKTLKGTDIVRLNVKNLPEMPKKTYEKFKKKLKTKKNK